MGEVGHNQTNKVRLGFATAAFLFVLIAFTPVSHAGGLGFAPLAVIAGLAGYIGFGRKFGFSEAPGTIIALLAFLLWAVLTSIWSPYLDPQPIPNPIKLLLGVLLYLGIFLLPPIQWMNKAIIAIGVLGLSLLVYDFHSDFELSKFFYPIGEGEHPTARQNSIYQNLSHGITVLALLAGPVIFYLARLRLVGPVLAVVWVLGTLYVAFIAGLAVGLLAMAMALVFMGLAWLTKMRAIDALIILAAISILFAPLTGYAMRFVPEDMKARMTDSWEHRVEMWAYVAEMIAQKPILGHGFDAVRTFERTYTGMNIDGKPWEQNIIALHPHNAGLHIWSETGAVGAALAAIALFMLNHSVKSVIKDKPDMVVPMAGFLAAALTLCTFTYGIWQEWFWGILILIGALIPMSIMNAD